MHLNTDRLTHTHQQSITICSWQKQELELTDVKQRQEGKNSSTVASEWVQVGEAVSLEKIFVLNYLERMDSQNQKKGAS